MPGREVSTFVTVAFTTLSHIPGYRRSMATKAATPWGPATVVEEVKVAQRAGEKRFASLVQLLEDERGEAVVRIAYTTDGAAAARPGHAAGARPRAAAGGCQRHAGLAQALGWGGRRLDGNGGRQSSSVDERAEDQRAVGRAEQRVDRVLRVRHQPEDVPVLVADARDVGDGAVRVLARRVAEEDLAVPPRAPRGALGRRTSSRRRA